VLIGNSRLDYSFAFIVTDKIVASFSTTLPVNKCQNRRTFDCLSSDQLQAINIQRIPVIMTVVDGLIYQ